VNIHTNHAHSQAAKALMLSLGMMGVMVAVNLVDKATHLRV